MLNSHKPAPPPRPSPDPAFVRGVAIGALASIVLWLLGFLVASAVLQALH